MTFHVKRNIETENLHLKDEPVFSCLLCPPPYTDLIIISPALNLIINALLLLAKRCRSPKSDACSHILTKLNLKEKCWMSDIV